MNERTPSQPKLKRHTVEGKAARSDRLAAEMRKNLMKRKRQQREMTDAAETTSAPADDGDDRS